MTQQLQVLNNVSLTQDMGVARAADGCGQGCRWVCPGLQLGVARAGVDVRAAHPESNTVFFTGSGSGF